MMASIWQGVTAAAQAEAYLDCLNHSGVPGLQATEGNRGVYVLRRRAGDRAHFLVISLWASADAIKKFAGADIEQARSYPEDEKFLRELESTVTHDEVSVKPSGTHNPLNRARQLFRRSLWA